jgi:predicted amidohydrolase YtcJ
MDNHFLKKCLPGCLVRPMILAILTSILVVGCSSNLEKTAIYFGGDILTMSDSDDQPVAAILIKNGKIAATGSKEEIFKQRKPDTILVDLEGKTLMPGFIAVHTHPDLSAYLYSFVDLSGFTNKTPEAVWDRLDTAVRNTPKGKWIFCKGFDPMLVKGLKSPDMKKLDAIAPDHPIVIFAQSLHSAWGNSLAFQTVGITAKTPDPAPGSFYEKDNNGKLTGFISEIAAIKPFSEFAVKEFDIVQNTVNVFDAYMANGFTSITTMGAFATDKKPFLLNEHLSTDHPRLIHKVLDLIGMLPDKKPTLRHFVYIKHDTPFLVPETVENGDDFFKVVGIKLWYDGSPYTGSMYLKEPYLNSELMLEGLNIPRNHYGSTVIKKDDFYKTIKKYHDLGWQLSVHSQGDKSTEEVLELMDKVLSGSDRKDYRHRIEHGVLMPPEQLGEMKKLKMTVSYHINHLYYYGLALKEEILGEDRAEKMLPVNSTKKSGVIFSLHADAPMYEEDPLSLVQTAVTRKTREGIAIGLNERISVMAGLKSLTIDSAWQLHMENKIGSLEPGKYADLVILDKNPLQVPHEKLRDIQVVQTIINGEVTWEQ